MSASSIPIHRHWRITLVVSSIMVLLALLGVGLTSTSKSFAPKYWMSIVPVFGLLCIGTAWYRARQGDGKTAVIRQVFHWLAVTAAIGFVFYIQGTGEENAATTGLNALLLLSLGCFLAGVHFEWLFMLVGALLFASLFVVDKTEQYLWVIVVIGIVAILGMVGIVRLIAKRSEHAAAKP